MSPQPLIGTPATELRRRHEHSTRRACERKADWLAGEQVRRGRHGVRQLRQPTADAGLRGVTER